MPQSSRQAAAIRSPRRSRRGRPPSPEPPPVAVPDIDTRRRLFQAMYHILRDECDHLYSNHLRWRVYFDTLCSIVLYLAILLLLWTCYACNLWQLVACMLVIVTLWIIKDQTKEENTQWIARYSGHCSLRDACKIAADNADRPNGFNTFIVVFLFTRTTLTSNWSRFRNEQSVVSLTRDYSGDDELPETPDDLLALVITFNVKNDIHVEYSTDAILSL